MPKDEKKTAEPQEISREEFMKRLRPEYRKRQGEKRQAASQRPKGASPFSNCARRARIPLQLEADGI